MMTPQDVLELLEAFEPAGISVWIDGGWGIDALLGEQTRDHNDLDLAIDCEDEEDLLALLEERGFALKEGWSVFANWVARDERGREVDVHLVDFAATRLNSAGVEVYSGRGLDYAVGSLEGHGTIGGRQVLCLTANYQMLSHTPYDPDEDDLRDVLALHRRLGVPLAAKFVGMPEPPPAVRTGG